MNPDLQVAQTIIDSIITLLNEQNQVVLAVPGGRSVEGIFSILSSASKNNSEIDWDRVHIFQVDERLVPFGSEDSNYRLIRDKFSNIHPFKIKDGLSSYINELRKYGGKFDIVLLSAGEDGHVAALFPNHHSVQSSEEYFLTMNDSPKQPKERMTLSPSLLKKSTISIILFYGPAKRQAYLNFLDKKITYIDCPAKLALLCKKNYVFIQK